MGFRKGGVDGAPFGMVIVMIGEIKPQDVVAGFLPCAPTGIYIVHGGDFTHTEYRILELPEYVMVISGVYCAVGSDFFKLPGAEPWTNVAVVVGASGAKYGKQGEKYEEYFFHSHRKLSTPR